ncbi:hypothetical protein MRX96_011707 [Rhipicephalus microplus]
MIGSGLRSPQRTNRRLHMPRGDGKEGMGGEIWRRCGPPITDFTTALVLRSLDSSYSRTPPCDAPFRAGVARLFDAAKAP